MENKLEYLSQRRNMENKTLASMEKEIEKGCRTNLDEIRFGEVWDRLFVKCGDIIGKERVYCPSCQAKLQLIKEIRLMIEKELFNMEQSRDCYGYNPHKVFTTNLTYNYPIEPCKTKEMRMLLNFAKGCYRNGWLQSIVILKELLKEVQGDKE
jgi:hypothetical protein